jgi:hypothetical protein
VRVATLSIYFVRLTISNETWLRFCIVVKPVSSFTMLASEVLKAWESCDLTDTVSVLFPLLHSRCFMFTASC